MLMTITPVNSGPGPCWLDGFPKVQLVTATGATLDLREGHAGQCSRKIPSSRVLLEVGAITYVEFAKTTREHRGGNSPPSTAAKRALSPSAAGLPGPRGHFRTRDRSVP
jgi:hypothetical protein